MHFMEPRLLCFGQEENTLLLLEEIAQDAYRVRAYPNGVREFEAHMRQRIGCIAHSAVYPSRMFEDILAILSSVDCQTREASPWFLDCLIDTVLQADFCGRGCVPWEEYVRHMSDFPRVFRDPPKTPEITERLMSVLEQNPYLAGVPGSTVYREVAFANTFSKFGNMEDLVKYVKDGVEPHPAAGSIYIADLVVLTPHMSYIVELKTSRNGKGRMRERNDKWCSLEEKMHDQLMIAAHFVTRNFHVPITLVGVNYRIQQNDFRVYHFAFDGGISLRETQDSGWMPAHFIPQPARYTTPVSPHTRS